MMDRSGFDQPEITQREISAVVKWFNPTKGFGFVQPGDGSSDAFLHISVLSRSSIDHLPQGATILCDLCAGPKGPQVASIHQVTDIPTVSSQTASGAGAEGGPVSQVEGTVKFYNHEKGFGFVVPDGGGKDVFISARTLELSGVQSLAPEQRVRMAARDGQRGPMAESIEIL